MVYLFFYERQASSWASEQQGGEMVIPEVGRVQKGFGK